MCGYSLEPPQRGGSYQYLQSIFLAEVRRYKLRPRCYKTFFMLNSTEHEICPANKQLHYNKLSMKLSLFINMKMPTIVGIFIFISREKNMFSRVEHKKRFITSAPDISNSSYVFKQSGLNKQFIPRSGATVACVQGLHCLPLI